MRCVSFRPNDCPPFPRSIYAPQSTTLPQGRPRAWEIVETGRWDCGRSLLARIRSSTAPFRRIRRPPLENVVARCSRDAPPHPLLVLQPLGACLARSRYD
ncbi:hypothetical protein K525DRAFT_214141 [Schizophyllum commune Loenen D]|nr:hypothetical protein K525DRAFT_214141 [Schizophyllum commune Loenen D]